MKSLSIFVIFSLVSSGCIFTPKLYETTDPNFYVQIDSSQVSEDELIEKNIKYFKDDKTGSFYAEKNSFQKLHDYTCRVIGTPVTVVLDTATIVVVAAAFLVVGSAIGEARRRGDETDFDNRRFK